MRRDRIAHPSGGHAVVTRAVRLLAPAKVNLALAVVGKREDGYHELRSVFATIDLADRVRVAAHRTLEVRISPDVGAPRGEDLASRAVRAMAEATRREPSAFVHIRKRVPVAAGLGGGSSDAGAVLRALATIWRGGCIIRAAFLDRIKDSYAKSPDLSNLMLAPFFQQALASAQPAWREVIKQAVDQGVPIPAFASSLAYYDGYRRARGPANLIQGLRDYFGAHTYHRTDREGAYHTRWAQDGSEVRTD